MIIEKTRLDAGGRTIPSPAAQGSQVPGGRTKKEGEEKKEREEREGEKGKGEEGKKQTYEVKLYSEEDTFFLFFLFLEK